MQHATIPHLHSKYAGQNLSWFTGDSEELYAYNLKHNYTQLEKYGWINREITYSFNSHGFRSAEFSNQDSIMFLGCSHTLGTGLPVEDTWASIVSNHLGLECCNLGLAGGACDSAFRIANHYIEKFQPKIVFLLAPDQSRLEIIRSDQVESITPANPGGWAKHPYYQQWIAIEENQRLNQEKNIMAINFLCQQHNVKFAYLYSWHTVNHSDESLDKARDLSHWGTKRNRAIAQQVLDTIFTTGITC